MTNFSSEEYPDYYEPYIQRVRQMDIMEALESGWDFARAELENLNEDSLSFQYEPGKWTVGQVLQHIIDVERVMAYRALTFARSAGSEVPGFDHDAWAINTPARSIENLKNEYQALRQTTIALFKGFSQESLTNVGKGNGLEVTVRALAYIIAGHERHHWNIIQERYLVNLTKA